MENVVYSKSRLSKNGKHLCNNVIRVKERELCRTVFHLLVCTVCEILEPQNFSGKSLSKTFSADLKSGINSAFFEFAWETFFWVILAFCQTFKPGAYEAT